MCRNNLDFRLLFLLPIILSLFFRICSRCSPILCMIRLFLLIGCKISTFPLSLLPGSSFFSRNLDSLLFPNATVGFRDMIPLAHQQKTFPSGRNGSVRVDALRQSRQRHPGGGLLRARRQYHVLRCTLPSDRSFAVSSSDSARAFSDAPESTCSSGGAFRTLRDLTIRIVKFWSSSAGDLVPYSQSSGS